MAKFIKYTKPSLSEVGKPALNPVEEVIISVDDIRSISHNNGGYFISTKLMDKVFCGTQVIAEDNLIIKVSKEDYEMTKKLLLPKDSLYEQFKGMSDSQVFQALLDDTRRAFNQIYPEDEFADATVEEQERERIKKALETCNGNHFHAANQLGMSKMNLEAKIKKYQL